MSKIKALIGTLLFALPFINWGQNVYTLSVAKEPIRIGNQFLFLRDTSKKLTLEGALNSDKFVPNKDDVPNYDITEDAIWGKIKFTCNEAEDWYLNLEPASLNKITFYQKRGNGPWIKNEEGSFVPRDANLPSWVHLSVKLDVKPGDTTTMLFRVNDFYPLQFDIKVGTLDSFVIPFHNNDIYYGLCFGVMLMMLIYNLYLFFTLKQRIYIFYVLYVFFNGIFLADFCGYYVHLPGLIKAIINFNPIIFPAGFGVFLLFFSLDLYKEYLSKRLLVLIYVFMCVVAVDSIIGALGYLYLAFNVIRMLGLLLGVLSLRIGYLAYRNGSSSAKFYLLGFGAYLSGLTFLILSGHLIPPNSVAIMAVITGSMVECVFLSFAQGDKLKVAQLEKEKAQQETVVQLQKNERLVKEQNIVLEQKVKERTAELAEKQKEILDSIHYAQRIQNTLLAHENLLMQNIPEHFILFKPKDIVSGDFYWASQKNDKFYLAICDSTGHGVPGAFMSLLNISFLNEAINEKEIEAPNEVFNYVRTHLVNSISRDGGRDGMDGILACIEKNGKGAKLTYAAANNEPIIIRNNEMIELGADKMPVGRGEKADSFTLHTVELQPGDILYLFTDGYADQFGGEKGKKFKYKQLQQKLLEITGRPLVEQKQELDKIFETWKGNLEQIDDVLVAGIKV